MCQDKNNYQVKKKNVSTIIYLSKDNSEDSMWSTTGIIHIGGGCCPEDKKGHQSSFKINSNALPTILKIFILRDISSVLRLEILFYGDT